MNYRDLGVDSLRDGQDVDPDDERWNINLLDVLGWLYVMEHLFEGAHFRLCDIRDELLIEFEIEET